jgi:hypothetical protein
VGPAGPQGIQGIQGPAGPTGVITFVTTAGFGLNPTAVIGFMGPTVNVTLAAGQRAHMVAERAFGSTAAGGANNLNIYPCYQNTAGGAITTVNLGIFGLTAAQNERKTFGVNVVYANLAAGTYTVGMCGNVPAPGVPANWNNNEWGYISALVF